jgi:hypothetical protein
MTRHTVTLVIQVNQQENVKNGRRKEKTINQFFISLVFDVNASDTVARKIQEDMLRDEF